jgi:glyoxylase-like metal-dependent hydrolase (beta-lactamase superfamily II)
VGKRAALVGIVLGLSSPGTVPAARRPAIYTIEELGPGVFAAIAAPRGQSTAAVPNAGFVIGSQAVLVVDGGASVDGAREVLAAVRARTVLPVRWLVPSSGGEAAGAPVLVREGAVEVTCEASRGRSGIAYRDRVTIWPGSRRVEVFARPGRAEETSLVRVPDGDVVFTGDLFWKKTLPDLAGARTDAWIRSLDGLLREYPAATFVPGRGGLAKALDVRQFRSYLSSLRLAVARGMRQGKSGPMLVEAVRPSLLVRFSSWQGLERMDGNVADTEAELSAARSSSRPPAP